MKRNLRSIFFLILLSSFSANLFTQIVEPAVFDTIMLRIRNDKFSAAGTALANTVNGYLALQQTNGSFSDINYGNTDRTNWNPHNHLVRINDMVKTYIGSGNSYYQNDLVYNAIVNGLQYWQTTNPKSSNWWYNQIAAPQSMGVILIGMRAALKQVPAALETSILTRMKTDAGDPNTQTGANKVDVGIHWMYRSCLEKNSTNLQYATSQIFQPLVFTTGEGIQQDWGYFQHGQQLYIGGYGRVLIDGTVNVAKSLVRTNYALSGDKLSIFSTFVRSTYLKSIRGQYHLFNILGRGLTRSGSLSQSGLAGTLETLKTIDPTNTTEYNNAIKRLRTLEPASFGIQPLNKHYWRGDYTLHQRQAYTFDVRMVSKRTNRNENLNTENLKGYFLSDGGTDIAVDGDEYVGIFPVWDWTKIPGTTTPSVTTIPKPTSFDWKGKAAFAGGVSDGVYGASGFDLVNSEFNVNTYGKKSWFFFDKEVVCLGAGINSTNSQTINTTLNQCVLKGDVVISAQGNATTQASSTQTVSQPDWVWHNKVAYYFPQGGNLSVSNQAQTGSWYNVNNTQSQDQVSKDVFCLWLNHGVQPTNANYAYIVVPNIASATQAGTYSLSNVEILANTDSVQAVHHKELGIYSLIFFKAASLTINNIIVKANKSCALMFKNIDQPTVKVFVADPAQENTTIKLRLTLPGISGERQLLCERLIIPDNGATREYQVDSSTALYVPENSNQFTIIDATEDSYVYGGAATTNYGTTKTLVVKKDAATYAREAFLKFPITNPELLSASKINLSLYVSNANTSVGSIQWIISKVSDNTWTESGITWNNRPSTTALSTIATVPTCGVGEQLLVDVTQLIKTEMVAGAQNLSIHVNGSARAADGKSDAQFHSRESDTQSMRPQLAYLTSTGILNPKIDGDCPIYPTQVHRGETVWLKNADQSVIEISDYTGRVLIKQTNSQIATSQLLPGIYLVKVHTARGAFYKKTSRLIII